MANQHASGEALRIRQWITCLLAVVVLSVATVAAASESEPERAVRYYEVLVRRPSPGYVFDRFYNAWLDESTVEELEAFLLAKAESGKSADGLMLAFFYAKQGDDVRTLEQFRETLSQDPGNAAAWYHKAIVEARTLDFETALADLQQAAELEPDDKLAIQVAKLRGRLLVRNRQRAEAIEVWNTLLAERPDDEELAEDVIELQIEEGLFDEAAELSQALIEQTKDPYKRTLRELRLGDIQDRGGKRAEAIATYRATLERVGAESWLEREILSQIERVFRREDDLSGLQKEYESLVGDHPRRVGIHRAHARVLSEAGDAKGAIEKFREILKLTPGDRTNQEAFIELHVQAEDLPGAIKHLESLIEQHPQDGELLVQLSQLQAKTGDKSTAGETIDRFLASSDKSEYSYLRAARLLEQLELTDAAKEKYATLVEEFADSISAKEAQAVFLYKIDEKEPALEIWRSLAVDADAQQLVRLARALASRNENELAYEILEKRHGEFGNNWLYLGQLINQALVNKKYTEAIPWALARVESSESSGDLSDAVAQASTVIERADEVLDMLEQLQSAEHKSLRKSCLVAELLEVSADSRKADEVLAPWIEQGEPLAVMQQVRLATRRYDWAGAAESMRRLLDLPGERKSQNVRRLIEFYERDFRIEEALNWVAEWKKLSPGSTTPWLTHSRLQLLSGKEEAAVDTLRQAAKEFDGNEEIRMQLAQLYSNMGKFADAQRIHWLQFEEAETLSNKLRSVEQLARLSEQQGSTEALVENFEERRRSNRQSVEPLLALATIHRVANNHENRRQALAEASKLKPEDLELLHEIARIEEQEGQWERAKATLEDALALDKTNRTRQRLARLIIQYGDPDEGYTMLYQLAGAESSDPRDIETVADSMIGAGDWQRAKDLLTTHLEYHPQDYRLRYLLGIICVEEGEQATAVEEFLTAMQADQEISGVTAPNQQGHIPSTYLSQLAELLPQEAIDIIQFQQVRYSVFSYRHQRAAYGYVVHAGGAGRGSQVQLPSSTEQVRQYALMHLLSIANTLDEDEQEQLMSRLHGVGVANAEVLLAVAPSDLPTQISAHDLLEKYRDNEAICAVMILGFSINQAEIPAEFYKDSFELFKERRPQLALMAAVQGASRYEELGDLLVTATDLLDQMQKPNSMMMMQLCSQIGRMHGQAGTEELPSLARERIVAKVLEWYPEVRNQQPYGQHIFMVASRVLRTTGEAKSFVRLIEDEVALHRSGSGGQRQGQQMHFGGQQVQFLSIPTFPPMELADFPTPVLQLLHSPGHQHDPYGQVGSPAWENDELAECLPQVKDPILRVLLASYVEMEEAVKETLEELLSEDKSPMLDAYLLGGTWAASREEYDEAIRMFEKARYLPMKRDMRRKVDEWLVATALEQIKQLEENEELQQTARDAALRLRHGTMQPDQRNLLVRALEDLGLKKEAELLDKKSTVAGASASPARVVYGATTQPATQDQISRLIDQGKRDVAAKRLANDALAILRQAMANPHNWSHSRYQLRQVRERIANYRLDEDVLAVLDPEDSDSHRKWADFAMFNETMEKYDEAQAAYRRALELRPNDDAYRSRLVFLLARQDPEAAIALCGDFGRNGDVQLVAQIFGQYRDHEVSIEDKVQLGEFALALLKHQSKQEKSDLSWGPAMCEAIGGQMYSRSGSIPSLYVQSTASTRRNTEPSETQERRQKLHDDFCRVMLEHPGTAEQAFTLLMASREARGELDDELADLASETLLKVEKLSQLGISNVYSQFGVYYGSSGMSVPRRTAAEFLIQHCFKSNDWSVLDEKVLPHVQEVARRDLVDEIEQYRVLFIGEPDEFVASAEQYVRQANRRIPQQSRYRGREPEQLVFEAWQARDIDVDFQPLILKFAESAKSQPTGTQAPNYLVNYGAHLAERDQSDRAVAFYEELAKVYLGPKEKREEFISRHYNRQMIQHNSPNGHIHTFANILQFGLQDQRQLQPVVQFIVEGSVGNIVQNQRHYVQSALGEAIQSLNGEEVVAYLENLGILSDLETFTNRCLAPLEGRWTIFSIACQSLRGMPKEKQDEVKKLLRNRESLPVSGKLLFAEWEAKDDVRFETLVELAEHFDALQQLDGESAGRLARLITAYPTMQPDDTTPPAVERLVEWIDEHNSALWRLQAEKILKAKRYEDLKVTGHDPGEWLAATLPPIVEHSPKKAADIYFHVAKLHDEAQGRHAVSMHFSNSAVSEMLTRMMHRIPQEDVSRTLLLLAVLEHEKANTLSFSFDQLDPTTVPIRLKYTTLFREIRQNKLSPSEFLEEYFTWLNGVLRQRISPILLTSFQYSLNLNNPNPDECKEMEEWLTERIAEGSDEQLSKYMLTALERFTAKRDREAAEKSQPQEAKRLEPSDYHHHLDELLADESISLPTRLVLAEMIFTEEKDRLPITTALAIMELAEESFENKIPFQTAHHQLFTGNVQSLFEQDEHMDRVATYWKAWHERFGRGRAGASSRQTGNLDVITSPNTLVRVLSLYLQLSEEETMIQFLHGYDGPLGKRPETAPLLVYAGKPDLALRFVRRHAPQITDHVTPAVVQYDEVMAANAEEFLSTIDDQQLRYFTSIWFATVKDAEPAVEGLPSRDERLTELANQLAEVTWRSPDLHQKALLMLCSSKPAMEVIRQDLTASADKINLPSMANNYNSEPFNETLELLLKRMEMAAGEGDFGPLNDFVSQTLGTDRQDNWQLRSAFHSHNHRLVDMTAKHLSEYNTDQFRQLAEVTCEIAAASQNSHPTYLGPWNSLCVIAHLRSGQHQEYQEWLESLEEQVRQRIQQVALGEKTWEWLANSFAEHTEANLQERLEIVAQIFHLTHELDWLRLGENLKLNLRAEGHSAGQVPLTKLLSTDELIEHGGQLLDASPAGGAAACALAMTLESTERWHEVSQFWRKAMEELPADQPKQQAWAQLRLANSLAQAGDREAAQEVFTKIEHEQMPNDFGVLHRKVQSELESEPPTAEKEGGPTEKVAERKPAA